VLFNEALEDFDQDSADLLRRAAARGHEEAIWILSVMKGGNWWRNALMKRFEKKETPLAYYLCGKLSTEIARSTDFWKKSAEGGCSWGQVAYGLSLQDQGDKLRWLEKAAGDSNPAAFVALGNYFEEEENDLEKAVGYYRAAAELGWKASLKPLACALTELGDLRQAIIWAARDKKNNGSGRFYEPGPFWKLHDRISNAFFLGKNEYLDCDFNGLCYSLGWGLYWYMYSDRMWGPGRGSAWRTGDAHRDWEMEWGKAFRDHCCNYYSSCVQLQRKSIFTFLWCWNRTTGVKEPGRMIAQYVWNAREDNLVKRIDELKVDFVEGEPDLKRIKF
jgi:hypothetical protein